MNLVVFGDKRLSEDLTVKLAALRARIGLARTESEMAAALRKKGRLIVVDDDCFAGDIRKKLLTSLRRSKRPFVVISSQRRNHAAILEARDHGAIDFILRPYHARELILRLNAAIERKRRIACIGGGTGLFTMLLGLKTLPDTLVVSIVNMSDDGGSSGKLSQAFGILPPGDIRRSLVALSNAPEFMNQIIQHRFEKGGGLQGHSFGNLFLTVLAEVKGSMAEAVRALGDILNIQGIVLPATRTLTTLVARFSGGTVVRGESKIDQGVGRDTSLAVRQVWHDPPPECESEAYASIVFSDLIVIGPGDLYTSIVTNLIVAELREAVVETRAKKLYVCNLMTKPGETAGYDANAHVRELVRHLKKDCLDWVIVSNTELSDESIAEYARKGQRPVLPPKKAAFRRLTRAKLVAADVGSQTELVRHDSRKLRDVVAGLLDTL